jgi:pimeloyl-ACP methyl ester carboxylesterase
MRRFVVCLGLSLVACGNKKNNAAPDVVRGVLHAPMDVPLPRTRDGWMIRGTFYSGEDVSTAVVLVHQLGSDRTEWGPLITRLGASPAVTVLAIDLRGHGASTTDPRNVRVGWQSFGSDTSRWRNTALDVVAAIEFLQTSNVHRIVVVGSSIGGSAALLAATGEPDSRETPHGPPVMALGWLSPGTDYRGVNTQTAMTRFLATGASLWMVAGEGDTQSVTSMASLVSTERAGVVREIFQSSLHGVALCNEDPTRWDRLDGWVRNVLGARTARSLDAGTADAQGNRP